MDIINKINEARKGPWNYIEESTDTQVSLLYDKESDTFTIKFQGSHSDVDWKNNFKFWKKPYKQMKKTFFIHSGFLKIYKSVRKNIHNEYLKTKAKNVVIEGYSLGAALATICYEDFSYFNEEKEYDINLSGFGMAAPRVTSFINYKTFNDRCKGFIRMENGNDAVTRVPFGIMGYMHVQKKDVIKTLKKRNFFYLLLPSSIYNHYHKSYKGYYLDKDYDDKDNKLRTKATMIYSIIYGLIIASYIIYRIVI